MRRALRLLVAYNAPLALWTAYALTRVVLGRINGANIDPGGWACPMHQVFSWCPGCGLTGDYVRLLRGELPHSWWFVMLFAALLINGLWSLRLAMKLAMKLAPEAVTATGTATGTVTPTPVSPPSMPESAPTERDPSTSY